MSPAPEIDHQLIQARLLGAFQNFVDQQDVAVVLSTPVDVQFSRFDIVEPDIVVILNDNLGIVHERRIVGPPDIVVEIVSPSSGGRDRIRKAALYAMNGVREYWLVDPKEKEIVVQILEQGVFVPIEQTAGTARSVVLEEFAVSLDRLFRPIGPDRSSSKEVE